MKPFDDLSEQELVALTENQIQRYIDYECAEQGVPLLPASLPEPENSILPDQDATIHAIKIGYSEEIYFTELGEASAVLELILRSKSRVGMSYVTAPNGNGKSISQHGPEEVQLASIPVFSAAVAASWKDRLAAAAKAQESYKKSREAYDKAVKERSGLAGSIRDKVQEALDRHRTREERRAIFQRYLDLADGNREIAAGFLVYAHSDAKELLPELYDLPEEPATLKPALVAVEDDDGDLSF